MIRVFTLSSLSVLHRVLSAFVFLGGEVSGFLLPPLAEAVVIFFFVAGVIILCFWGWQLRGRMVVTLFLLGFVLALYEQSRLSTFLDGLYGLTRIAGTPICDVLIAERPEVRITRNGSRNIVFDGEHGGLRLKVSMPYPKDGVLPVVGETWRLAGWIGGVRNGANRFSGRPFRVPRHESARRIATDNRVWMQKFTHWRELSSGRINRVLTRCPRLAAMLGAILFGERDAMPTQEREIFAAAGTIHVFAISGLHVMMVVGIIIEVLKLMGIGMKSRYLIALPVMIFYVLLTGARPSAIRAALMVIFGYTAPLFGRKASLLSGWAYAVFIVYGLSPRMLFDVGCTFSFVVMFGIGLWLASIANGTETYDLLSRKTLIAPGERYLIERWLWLKGNFAVSSAAWAAGVPVTAILFGRFTIGALAANVFVVPLATFTVINGMFGVLFGMISSMMGTLFINLAALGVKGMVWVSERVAAWPGATIEIMPWGIGTIVAWYIGCLAVCLIYARQRNFKLWGHKRYSGGW